ncbi:DinB family protein [Pleomorphovibrio marinus]|uniref:DinB family protein n=1 Tax=Pleomorphovibrio marinus TaxID=2164132 RepID=UPI000E0BB9D7|nr:DinB family protein [Pleomorphovibrio marinus]
MKNTSILLGILLALVWVGQKEAFAQTNMEEFLAKWENGKQFTLEVVDKMPNELLDYKPHESAMSFREQVTHVGASIANMSKGFLNGADMPFDPGAKPESKEDIKKFISACYDYGRGTISSLSEAELAEEIETFVGKITRRQMISFIDDHATHHRGAAISYIRSNGITPPGFRGS